MIRSNFLKFSVILLNFGELFLIGLQRSYGKIEMNKKDNPVLLLTELGSVGQSSAMIPFISEEAQVIDEGDGLLGTPALSKACLTGPSSKSSLIVPTLSFQKQVLDSQIFAKVLQGFLKGSCDLGELTAP